MNSQRDLPGDFVTSDYLISSSIGERHSDIDQSTTTTPPRNKQKSRRPKMLGRPKNGWTASRKRKLVRLYLNTELDIEEIGRILETKSFRPCKRDIQKNLNMLLQHRPNQIRPKGKTAKERIQLLMECKSLKLSSQLKPQLLADSTTLELQTQPPLLSYEPTDSLDSTPLTPFVRDEWPESLASTKGATKLSSDNLKETELGINDDLLGLGGGIPACYDEHHDRPTTPENVYPLPCTKLTTPVSGRLDKRPFLDPLQVENVQPFTAAQKKTKSNLIGDSGSVLSLGKKDDFSLLSIRSLKKRLKSKYTMSDLDDIKSLTERLTISDSDTSSIHQSVTSPTTTSSSWRLTASPIILPGVFSKYCWDHISTNGRLQTCDDIRLPCLPCNHIPFFDSQGIYLPRHWPFGGDHRFHLRQEDFLHRRCTDIFGNSVLHIAAALGSSLSFMISLITAGADVSCVNSANQTFLHLLDIPDVSFVDDYLLLLEGLQKQNFRFEIQDLNGRMALSWLMQPKVPQEISTKILDFAKSHDLKWSSYWDNLEHITQNSMCEFCDPRPAETQGHDNVSYASLGETHLFETARLDGQENHPSHFFVFQTPASQKSPGEYEYHANLIKTIRKASDQPEFEDDDGRNGLHCLSEVFLDLPIPSTESTTASGPTDRRQQYLEQLLQAGVNPNSHDKNGNTPLMSFIFHLREDEDDTSTCKLLEKLCQAGANIHRRNANGETALHIAVKLGRRAATKFLLSHDANIHARTAAGKGILALGFEHSQLAPYDEMLYAQISLCMSLIATAGAVSAPSLVDEWAIPQLKHSWMTSLSGPYQTEK